MLHFAEAFRHFVCDVGVPFHGGTDEQAEVRLLIHGLKNTGIQSDIGVKHWFVEL